MSSIQQQKLKKIAVVTGASSGIGYEITNELAKNNYIIYACARRVDPIQQLVDEFSNAVIKPHKLDISNPEEITQFKQFLSENLPNEKLDLLYNNAGQSCTFPALDVSNDVMEQCFKVNVFGHVNMCRELSQFLINAKGTIVFTGSLAGITPFPFGSIYSATKAAIHQYARVLHLELKPFGVRVINAVTGAVKSNIADTRPLPETSVFNFAEGQEAFKNRQLMAKKSHPMPADVYAKKLVKDIMSGSDPVDIYRGKLATVMSFIMLLVPYRILEFGLKKYFKLDKVFEALDSTDEERLKRKSA
ncbi:acylglycerone-phosphate reductase NDAI_0B03800 [Naumovozyma dairenensis CBS 421]|uniref:NADPH-dependent 1-acyldihydroxyacetone phosphate reductase n=1 Tax=Naumovozyma dairenensis (strain ATCC 10597 / BCRC 20456 / CBS 421 / NBRC 0211 / NRRL Y-12639) TaxID=1071378 RepID=G0W6K3_NAUDC|nr:hypothetical protein NDAI_0B03800 [Naumovozyma dairenensis CBS 421]CCD23414.1 hypothetical protein NDAI_0B03800 [Naumovozyma dairenensis CBS 421]